MSFQLWGLRGTTLYSHRSIPQRRKIRPRAFLMTTERSQFQAPFFIGVDVGGTTIKVGVVDDNGRPMSKCVVPTEPRQPVEVGMANLERCVHDAVGQSGLSMSDIHSVGLATPGTMDITGGSLLEPGNLPTWHFFPIRQHVADRLQTR